MFQDTEIGSLLAQVWLLTMMNMLIVQISEEDQMGHLHTSLSTASERYTQQPYSDIRLVIKNMATLKEKCSQDRKT